MSTSLSETTSPLSSHPKKITTVEKAKDVEIPLPKKWTKVASEKHPGKYYYFNVETKQSIWDHPSKSNALEQEEKIIRNMKTISSKIMQPAGRSSKQKSSEKVVQLSNDTNFKKRNLAMARLDNLRKQLEVERKRDGEKIKSKAEKKKSPQKKVESIATSTPLSPNKRKPSEFSGKLSGSSKADVTKKSAKETLKSSPKSKGVDKSRSPMIPNQEKKLANSQTKLGKDSLKTAIQSTSNLKAFKIPKKPPEQQMMSPLSADKRKMDEQKLTLINKTVKHITSDLKTESLKKVPENVVSPMRDSLLSEVVKVSLEIPRSVPTVVSRNVLLETNERLVTPIVPSPVTESKTPKFSSTKKLELRSPANERLMKIRTELTQEVSLQSTILSEDAEMTDLSELSDAPNITEEMEWEDIPAAVAVKEVEAVRQKLDLIDHYPNQNVLQFHIPLFDRLSYQKYFFMVLDTNIFLSHLKGLERMLETEFPHIGQPILLIPYIVLQELDRIKHRTQDRSLSQAASQSIRFLNERLRKLDPRVKGQSSLEAANRLIEVENPDDNIVNCCLQVRQAILGLPTELMLLSNDINLRNKMLVNGVQAFSFAQLTAETDRIRFAADDAASAIDTQSLDPPYPTITSIN
ncbi:transcriptional protein SWT1 [Malaya genurostris]|uniref:transcriptional protein SWT1 n=1 Tax=Malaya genurostris TaxID=325434 RepID=UPI0026F3A186|nr:transcriptional protein SWT1 [Malaya genurostris]